ncbi:hypothetical protein CRENPOLYSF2_3660002 [Crenothrix polyspora]|uniref:Uncharacterized protein n=1 Tax=Crenothrix polyspora TaxID=360316 RepID=A0A1R4HC59_9GAMM|nr:hypothetical protein CRENPOLYSF2_3660002 [Crenothrix polyspora]
MYISGARVKNSLCHGAKLALLNLKTALFLMQRYLGVLEYL